MSVGVVWRDDDSGWLVRAGADTQIGPFRETNQDHILLDPEVPLALVLDGMGGPGGERAAQIGAEAIRDRARSGHADGESPEAFLDAAFREAWAIGNRIAAPAAHEMDAALHRERLEGRSKRLHPLPASFPDGTMLAAGTDAFLIREGKAYRWRFGGYTHAEFSSFDALITPPSTLAALAAGYRPVLHSSAM